MDEDVFVEFSSPSIRNFFAGGLVFSSRCFLFLSGLASFTTPLSVILIIENQTKKVQGRVGKMIV